MKRILWPLLLILLLCGCTEPAVEETTLPATTAAPTEVTEPVGIYVPFSDLEIQTDGAVSYFMPEGDCYGIRMMGNDLLVFSGAENTVLTRYAGEQLFAVAGARLDCRIDPEETSFQISSNGITYYNPDTREVVFLDNDLKEVRRLAMPGNMVGKPVLSANRMYVYYCTSEAIRVYDTATGLDKLLKSISYKKQSAEDVLLNDSVLRCSLTDDREREYTIFISTQTGETLSQIHSEIRISTHGDSFFADVPEGILQMRIFGRLDAEPRVLLPSDPFAQSWFLESAGGLVSAVIREEAVCLDYYDLTSGLRTAAVELPGGIVPKFAEIRPDTGEILVMAYDDMADAPVILSWRKDATPLADATVYSGSRYTAEKPDVAGLEACGTRAREIAEKYGVEILLAEDAVSCQPWDYILEMEYQTGIIREQLETLEGALSHFPAGFFGQLPGKMTICLVRAIRGNAQSGNLENAQGIQFWDKNQPYVALAAGDTLESTFYHEIFHVMDSKILSDTRVYYHWNSMNPQGVSYFQDYTSYLEADVDEYLEDENRIFIDAYSMCYPREERARIMEYACMPDNAHYFQSEVMQNKLRTLCEGIRKAFHLGKYEESFLWEQYLREPLAP